VPFALLVFCAVLGILYVRGGGREAVQKWQAAMATPPVSQAEGEARARAAVELVKDHRPASSALSIATRLDLVTASHTESSGPVSARQWRAEATAADAYEVTCTIQGGNAFIATYVWNVDTRRGVVKAASPSAERLEQLRQHELGQAPPLRAVPPPVSPPPGVSAHRPAPPPRIVPSVRAPAATIVEAPPPDIQLVGVLETGALVALFRTPNGMVEARKGERLASDWTVSSISKGGEGRAFVILTRGNRKTTLRLGDTPPAGQRQGPPPMGTLPPPPVPRATHISENPPPGGIPPAGDPRAAPGPTGDPRAAPPRPPGPGGDPRAMPPSPQPSGDPRAMPPPPPPMPPSPDAIPTP